MLQTAWLGDVYQQYRRELFLAAWTVLRDADLAEDAVHSAFAKLTKLTSPPTDPKLFVFRSVRNAAIDVAKARSRRREEPLPTGWDPASADSPFSDAEPLQSIAALLDG